MTLDTSVLLATIALLERPLPQRVLLAHTETFQEPQPMLKHALLVLLGTIALMLDSQLSTLPRFVPWVTTVPKALPLQRPSLVLPVLSWMKLAMTPLPTARLAPLVLSVLRGQQLRQLASRVTIARRRRPRRPSILARGERTLAL